MEAKHTCHGEKIGVSCDTEDISHFGRAENVLRIILYHEGWNVRKCGVR